jgi:hypothetical protein
MNSSFQGGDGGHGFHVETALNKGTKVRWLPRLRTATQYASALWEFGPSWFETQLIWPPPPPQGGGLGTCFTVWFMSCRGNFWPIGDLFLRPLRGFGLCSKVALVMVTRSAVVA